MTNVNSAVNQIPGSSCKKEMGKKGLNLSVSGAVTEDVPGMMKRLVKMVRISGKNNN